jgi:protein-L-isoaspartate(D-aspartate) O-methyltransferase
MIENHLRKRGIKDERIMNAFLQIERHHFIESLFADRAYADSSVPISDGQTISQPYIVAKMTELLNLKENDKVLEVGTGSGFQASILAVIGMQVYSIERHQKLLNSAREKFSQYKLAVKTMLGDGTIGWPDESPFQGIIVTAGGPMIPKALLNQLDQDNGKLVMPVGDKKKQELICVTRNGSDFSRENHGACIFVPLIGREGF